MRRLFAGVVLLAVLWPTIAEVREMTPDVTPPALPMALLIEWSVNGRGEAIRVIQPSDCSRTEVGTAVGAAADGDTVTIPAGTCAWSSGLTITRGITLEGAGCDTDSDGRAIEPCDTVIQDDIANGASMLTHTLVEDFPFRVTGIHFDEGTRLTLGAGTIAITGQSNTDYQARIDHNVFTVRRQLFVADTVIGLVDGNYIARGSGTAYGSIGSIKGSFWDSVTDIDGDGAWAEGCAAFGTQNSLYFENNTVEYLGSGHATMLDAQAGGRYVFRYNTIIKGSTESHGTESGSRERSGCNFEVYGNTFTGSDGNNTAALYRGGNGVIWGNTATDYQTSNGIFKAVYFRAVDPYTPWGGADGRNAFDVNDSGGTAGVFESGTATGGGTLTMTDSSQSWTSNQWVGYTLVKTSGIAVSSMSRSSTTVTVNLASAHGIPVSSTAWWSICCLTTGKEYEARWLVTATDEDTFTFTVNGTTFTANPTVGTAIAMAGNWYSLIASNTSTQITFETSIFGASHRMSFSADDTYEIRKVTHGADMPGRNQGSQLTAGIPTRNSLPVGWNDQVTNPWLEWSNTLDGNDADFSCSHIVGCGTHALNDVATGTSLPADNSGGDYFFDTDAGTWNTSCGDGSDGVLYKWDGDSFEVHYTPYECPHPLTTGEGGGGDPDPQEPGASGTGAGTRIRLRTRG